MKRKFYKSVPDVGDELEFDGHIVTIEAFEGTVASTPTPTPTPPQPQPQRAPFRRPMQSMRPTMSRPVPIPQPPEPSAPASPPPPAMQTTTPQNNNDDLSSQSTKSPEPPQMIPKKRIVDMSLDDDDEDEMMDIDPPSVKPETLPLKEKSEPVSTPTPQQPPAPTPQQPAMSAFLAPPKRVRVGLSKRTSSTLHQSTHREALSAENITPSNTATASASTPQTSQMNQPKKHETPLSTERTSGTPSTR